MRQGLEQIFAWSTQIGPNARVSLNMVLTGGERLIGSRLNRSLFYLLRDHFFDCPIRRKPHVHHEPKSEHQSIEVALEPITHGEDWYEVPNGTLFRMAKDYRLDMETFGRNVVA